MIALSRKKKIILLLIIPLGIYGCGDIQINPKVPFDYQPAQHLPFSAFLYFPPENTACDKTRDYAGSKEYYNISRMTIEYWLKVFRTTLQKVAMQEGTYFPDSSVDTDLVVQIKCDYSEFYTEPIQRGRVKWTVELGYSLSFYCPNGKTLGDYKVGAAHTLHYYDDFPVSIFDIRYGLPKGALRNVGHRFAEHVLPEIEMLVSKCNQ